ncbi:MAG: hypothetical protein A3J67_04275 [Parcubacteria group bacterium RIFCSPHIGHO2_02_FULL_48_10b]|nr:MAG: hypothetical protein A3J67_04275 [Parcubacteria group bacterium RIFCSPHIGHO2_02_FULL_48_10b]
MLFRNKNTVRKGRYRYIIFNDGDIWYGVALEFNLVIDADSPERAYVELHDAVRSYVETVRVNHIRDSVLNQNASSEYSKLWKALENGNTTQLKSIAESELDQPINQPITVDSYGFLPQPA